MYTYVYTYMYKYICIYMKGRDRVLHGPREIEREAAARSGGRGCSGGGGPSQTLRGKVVTGLAAGAVRGSLR